MLPLPRLRVLQGQGLLTDNLTPERVPSIRMTRMTGVTWDTLQPLRRCIAAIAGKHGKTMAQVAINWSISKGHVALVGCKTVAHVEAAAGALGWRLSAAEVSELDAAAMDRSTLEKPRWRRGFFMGLLSVLVFAYYVERWFWFPNLLHVGRVVPPAHSDGDTTRGPVAAPLEQRLYREAVAAVKRRRWVGVCGCGRVFCGCLCVRACVCVCVFACVRVCSHVCVRM